MRKFRTAVIGCGVISEKYMTNLKDRFNIIELYACSDLDGEKMRARADQFGVRAMTFEEILANPLIKLVINLTNPAAHYSLTKRALLAGKNVYSEKMMSVTLEEGAELCRIAKEKGVSFGVAPDTFLGAGVQTARWMIDHGLIGKALSFNVSLSRDFGIMAELLPHLRKVGGGIAFDVGCYYLTALASLFGPADQVSAFASIHEPNRIDGRMGGKTFEEPYEIETENVIAAIIRYRSGVIGTFHLNSDSIIDENRILRIFGTEGILNIGNPDLFGSEVTLEKPFGGVREFPFTHGFQDESRGIGAAELAWSVEKQRPCRASCEMGYHILEMLHGILRSAKEGKPVQMQSSFTVPRPLPAGYIGDKNYGIWAPTEETALSM